MDKAGAYAIQDDEKFHIIQKIKGSLTNIMGFPIESISDDLKSFNII
jgi:predicted house-cleaning NTP pyrophosphatase (Maf/HAM1 superfamily)